MPAPSSDQPSPRVPLRLRIPEPMLEAVDRFARRCGVTRSEAVQDLLSAELSRRDLWPPTMTGDADAGR